MRIMVGLCLVAVTTLMLRAEDNGGGLSRFEAVETHMGSPFRIVLYTPDVGFASRGFKAAFARIASLDKALSDYDPESELMRLCDRAGGPPVKVGDDLFDVLARSVAIAERSGGAFDPTIAPVVRLWRRARRERKLPDPQTLDRAQSLVGYKKITLDAGAKTVRLEAGVKLDLGGIAKGYASEQAVRTLKGMGITRSLVAGAGDIVVGDPPPGEEGWTVGVAPLDAPGARRPEMFLRLRNQAVSTAGDAERYVEIDGVRYSHIVDPKTGIGQTERTSVTVVANDGGTADGLDTAASVLGPEEGLRLVQETKGAEGLFVRGGKTGEVRVETKGFRALVRPQNTPRP
jgi:thiamine biosynthesis lipoprotein